MTTEPAPQPQFMESPERPEGVEPRSRPRWPPWMSVAALVAGFAGTLFGALVLGVIAVAFGADFDDQPASVQILATIVQDLCLIGSAIVFARMAGRVRPRAFGLRPPRVPPAPGWGGLLWVGVFAFPPASVSGPPGEPRRG